MTNKECRAQMGFLQTVFLIATLLYSCSELEPEASLRSLSNISDIIVLDNGNAGDASDIEVNFTKQEKTDEILEYRVFMTKTEVSNTFGLKEAQTSTAYGRAMPEDVFLVEGLFLNSSFTDTDGDLITDQNSYTISVLSVSKDRAIVSDAFTKDTKAFRLKQNNLIKNHTKVLDVGMGSLAIDDSDNLYMATSNIISELSDNLADEYSVLNISKDGDIQPFTDLYPALGGNDFDSDGNLYLTVLKSGKVLKVDKQGAALLITKEDDDRGFKLESVNGVFINSDDQLFVVDNLSNSIVEVDADGTTKQFAKIPPSAKGITGDELGNLYVSHNSENGLITKVRPNGEVSEFARIPTLSPINYPLEYLQWIGYIKYQNQKLYVTSPSTDKIFNVDMDGAVTLFAGSGFRFKPRGAAISANLNRPYGLVFSNDKKTLYISGSADTEPRHTQSSSPSIIWKIELVE